MDLISEGLFRVLSEYIGPECIVKIRQENWELRNIIESCNISERLIFTFSGSTAEGFSFKSSDYDILNIDRKVIVLDDKVCCISDKAEVPTVITMESDNVPPGFTLLRCLRFDIRNEEIYRSLVWRGKDVFVSSQIARESHYRGVMLDTNGPCKSGVLMGNEFDSAYTLRCPIWPIQAKSFIHRSMRNNWPSVDTLQEICHDGCLLVPINSKKQTFIECTDLEWRISFSLAEKKLVHTMNHCQFLCYGLMKIVLNEVLKLYSETGELLCSYFLKTALFWEISEGTNEWSHEKFINNFWIIFRRLMKWVSAEYCPNYFIPEHNMFYGKIYGRLGRELLMDLRSLYDEGYLCFLRSASLEQFLTFVINNRFLFKYIPSNGNYYGSLDEIEKLKISSIMVSLKVRKNNDIVSLIRNLCNTACLVPKSNVMASAIKLKSYDILQGIGFLLLSQNDQTNSVSSSNRSRYWYIKVAKSMLRQSFNSFRLNLIQYAVCVYRSGNYFETVKLVLRMKQRFQSEQFMYWWNLDGDIILNCRQQGMPYDVILNKFVISEYTYDPELSIEELYLESLISRTTYLFIPPLVILNFLLFLSYTRLYKNGIRHKVLCELYSLLYYDNGLHIYHLCKAISWEILGICQQLCGDYYGAYQSYVNALHDEFNEFRKATIIRIHNLFL